MKRRMLPLLTLVGFGFCSFLLVPQSITFREALDQGLIKAEYSSLGGSSQECVAVEITNLSNRDLKLKIEPGLHLHTEDPDEQDILITRDQDVLVQSKQSAQTPLYGFCSQSFNMTPSEESGFNGADYDNDALCQLARYLNENPADANIEQNAIWTISGGHPLAAILAEEGAHQNELRKFCADLREEEEPWYDIEYGNVLDAPFVDEPQKIAGSMSYQVEETGMASLICLDPDGELLVRFFENRPRYPMLQYTQSFDFTATNMKRGEYKFQLLIGDEVIQEELVTL